MPTDPSAAPLRGVGVVVTRDEDEDGRLTAALEARGASVLYWPTIEVAPPADPGLLHDALARLDAYDWIAFTSRRAVAALGAPPSVAPWVAAVGRSTAAAAESAGWSVQLVPEQETGAGLVAAMAAAGVGPGARVLFPASEIARDTVPSGLRSLGAEVEQVPAYRIVPAPLDRAACERARAEGRVSVLTVTSPSAVRNLRTALGDELFERLLGTAVVAAIGPTTAEAARAAGARDVVEAEEASLDGLAERVVAWSVRDGERGA